MKKTTLFFLALFISAQLFSQTTPTQMIAKMGRGINLGNVMSAPIEGNWAPAVEETYFDDVKAKGFKTVRIPIRFDTYLTPLSSVNYTDAGGNYIGSSDDYTLSTAYLDRIEQVTDWALNKGLIAIIDVHGDHWFWDSYNASKDDYRTGADREAAVDRFKALWKAVSLRFKNKPDELLFEIMNEAYFSMSKADVDIINPAMLSIIREENPTRIVIVNGGGDNTYKAPQQMESSFLASDNYLMATFHYYVPFNFTSSGKEQYTDNDWGTQSDYDLLDTHFDQVKTWATNNGNIPVLLGEFGADNVNGHDYSTGQDGDHGGPDAASRKEYHRYVAKAAIDRGFAFTVWDAGEESNKTIYKVSDRTWVEDIIDALFDGVAATKEFNFDTDGDAEGWGNLTVSGGIATGSTSVYATTTAAVDASSFNYAHVLLKNNTSNGMLRMSFPQESDNTKRTFINIDNITENNSDFEYIDFDCTGLDGWTATVNDIKFHVKDNGNAAFVADGTIEIDKIIFDANSSLSTSTIPKKLKDVIVSSDNGTIYVKGANLKAVYSITGVLLENANLSHGIYLVVVTKNNQTEVVKLVI
ncbi:hypothetical protein AXE80_10305 [Wenyingzhuangia fucanilytica]|uniref:Glycoside hydrolase family 5 domain-containing protein n=1 Tax=Wenyingzhuangia fucanilytica TaxID=1790137 RepID=A0A1B1Y785_9FLAO|nr:glycoside hydrolase family 5 protein [Wenyingzhuangia fucanilytica]ANW96642.1 hypothetical protein AXE80_10305 [Wenyingzhuangia fucanilytica]